LEHGLRSLGIEFEIVPDGTLHNCYAEAIPVKHLIRITETVYDGACCGNPRDRFTIAHEIGHLLLHTPDKISFARAEKIKKYEQPEWQANTFAGELLVHTGMIAGLSVQEVARRYEVSFTVASIQIQNA